MKINFLKIIIIFFLIIFFGSCSITKNLNENDYVLEKNRVLINDKLIQSDSLDRLIVLKENKKFLGVPVQSLIYQSGFKNTDSIFTDWEKNKNNRKGLKKFLSKKQFLQLKKYYQSWNEWKLKNGEAVSLIDSLKINQTLSNFMSYFQNIGYLETTVGFDLSKNKLKQKDIGILITDHNVRETLSITDRSYLLFEGSILKSGTTKELAEDEEVRKVYLGQKFDYK